MFCTKCGKQLHDGDAFCAHCGTKVRDEILREEAANRSSKYDEVVFNPPFKAEAERRTKQISQELEAYSSEPKKENVTFDWNLDGFPSQGSKNNDDFEIKWDEVIEKRRREPDSVAVEKLVFDEQKANMSKMEDIIAEHAQESKQSEEQDEPKADDAKGSLSIADLERELFGTEVLADLEDPTMTVEYSRAKANKEQQFFTYNAKKNAFQELLDKEKARVESMESKRQSQWDEITSSDLDLEQESKEPPEFEEIFVEPKLPLVPPVKEVAVVVPPKTATVMANEAEEAEKEVIAGIGVAGAAAAEAVKEVGACEEDIPPSEEGEDEEVIKTKLRYSDVFPRDGIVGGGDNGGGNGGGNSAENSEGGEIKPEPPANDDDDDDEEINKGSKILKTIIIILAIIVAVELVVIGVKLIAPNSGFAKSVDSVMSKVTRLFDKSDDAEATDTTTTTTAADSYIDEYILLAAADGTNIGSITHNTNLKYNLNSQLAFEGVSQSLPFEDSYISEDASLGTYGQAIISAVVNYYNGWQENNQDTELVGINNVDIGEIRADDNGYYILSKVVYAAENGETVEKYETVYLNKAASGDLTVNDIKEEKA